MGFAVKLVSKQSNVDECLPLIVKPEYSDRLVKLRELLAPLISASETLIQIDYEKCIGCGNCVVACPENIILDPRSSRGYNSKSADALWTIEDGKIKILHLEKCRRYPPSRLNCNVCELVCYSGAIRVVA